MDDSSYDLYIHLCNYIYLAFKHDISFIVHDMSALGVARNI